jgi:hypothetical protein
MKDNGKISFYFLNMYEKVPDFEYFHTKTAKKANKTTNWFKKDQDEHKVRHAESVCGFKFH